MPSNTPAELANIATVKEGFTGFILGALGQGFDLFFSKYLDPENTAFDYKSTVGTIHFTSMSTYLQWFSANAWVDNPVFFIDEIDAKVCAPNQIPL